MVSVVDRETDLVTVETAARALGVGRNTCYALLADGRLRSVKVGRRRLVPVHALDEFVALALDSERGV